MAQLCTARKSIHAQYGDTWLAIALGTQESKMMDGLVAGRLMGDAEQREGKGASLFAIAKVKATTHDGEPVLVNVIAFAAEVRKELMLLREGDAVALAGSLVPKVWTDKQGNTKPAVDMVANRVLSVNAASVDAQG